MGEFDDSTQAETLAEQVRRAYAEFEAAGRPARVAPGPVVGYAGPFPIYDAPTPKWAATIGPPTPTNPEREAKVRAHLERGLAWAWAASQGGDAGPQPGWPAELALPGGDR